MAHRLALEGLEVHLRGTLLYRLSAEIGPGEVLAVAGPSGSGKSTLLAHIAGFLDPAFEAKGRIFVDGRDVTQAPPEARRIGLLFQDPMLFPHLSVAGNLLFGLARKRGDRRRLVVDALASSGLAGFESRDPATLSGGQKARVALLRVLLSDPCAILLDEPFSKLDPELRSEFRGFVFERLRQALIPTVLVTHDRSDAYASGDNCQLISLVESDPGSPGTEASSRSAFARKR
jgi:putative thiamine transport system ATP-binding protein